MRKNYEFGVHKIENGEKLSKFHKYHPACPHHIILNFILNVDVDG